MTICPDCNSVYDERLTGHICSSTAKNQFPNFYFGEDQLMVKKPMENKGAWICPKCGRVYANWIMECQSCNKKITEEEERKKC